MVEFALKCAKICIKMVENALTFPRKPMFLLFQKGYLISQAPSCIIYLESESDMTPICPQ